MQKKLKINLLLTNSGRRTYRIDFLKTFNRDHLNIFLADASDVASFYINKNIYKIIIPKVKYKKKFVSSLENIIEKKKINLIIPLSNHELEILSKYREKWKTKYNCDVIISDTAVIKICRDKTLTKKFCDNNKILSPKILDNIQNIPNNKKLVLKHRSSSGSKDLEIDKKKNIKSKVTNKMIVQEFVNGNEYNIDILNDMGGNFIDCCIKKKLKMRAGETDKCEILYDHNLYKFSKRLSHLLKHKGNLDCDVIKNNKGIFLIDLNCRFGGGYAFTHVYGKNYLKSIINNNFTKYKLEKKEKKIFFKGIDIIKKK